MQVSLQLLIALLHYLIAMLIKIHQLVLIGLCSSYGRQLRTNYKNVSLLLPFLYKLQGSVVIAVAVI